ncbi:MAG: NADP-dependent 3-hydroxy acid dehydrogenase YdfG [Chlamydiales bacterium]|nr:NADP-dependent 3-hydroxy acid dehydrogenase YdfG [Chlamydiales bacterium]
MKGKTAFITGASSGIGQACAEKFAMLGMNVIITGRRIERLRVIASDLASKYKVQVTPIELDVQIREQVNLVFDQLQQEIDILVNNAGLALSSDKVQDADVAEWEVMIDTNFKGLLYVTKAVLPSMIERNRGHIINIGSIAGHDCYISGNIYSATKHAVRAISKSLRMDLLGTGIRVSEVAPGAVETEFSEVRWKDKDRAKQFYHGFDPLVAEDIADAVLYCATRPQRVNIAELVIFPQAQASITNVHRQGEVVKSAFDTSEKKK